MVIFLNKILVNIYVVSLGRSYDLFIPINITGTQLLDLLQKALISLSNENYIYQEKAFLLDRDTGYLINQNNTIKFSGIKNGSNLLLAHTT